MALSALAVLSVLLRLTIVPIISLSR